MSQSLFRFVRVRTVKMKTSFIRQVVLPVLAALIWGTAFVAQSMCADRIPPFAFNALRSAVAVPFLLLLSLLLNGLARRRGEAPEKTDRRTLLLGGVCCGAILALAANLQQAGIADTAAGKAGFITAFYVVLVPVFGIFLRRKTTLRVWVSVAVAAVGLYLLCIRAGEGFSLQTSDLFLILCAVSYGVQIYTIDYFALRVDGVKLACAQFFWTAVFSAVLSLIIERGSFGWSDVTACLLPLLYVGVFSSGVAYTFQILAQKGSNPAIVTLLFSLESVFSVLAGAILLGDRLTGREYLGCGLMFAGVILAELPVKTRKETQKQLQ